ncbi:hypothetical protein RKD05_002581 [Microbacterium sp. SLBN-111]
MDAVFSFFPPDRPANDEPMDDRVPERVPAFEPPSDELAVPIATSTILGRGDDVVIVLAGARVHSDGVEFLVDRYLRRGGRDARQWHLIQMDFAGHWGMSLPGPDRLRFGLALGNGERLFIDDRFAGSESDEPGGHTLRMTGHGGSGGEDRYTLHDGLWLWPLPPDGPLELVVQWPAFGIPETRAVLDGTELRSLAGGVRPIWE